MVNYPIGDFLIKIKNAALAGRSEVVMPYSKLVFKVAELLKKEKFLRDIKKNEGDLVVDLSYMKKQPVLVEMKLVSKPGRRVYKKVDELKKLKGLLFYIISTPEGVMTSKEAIKKNLGGEVIAEIH